MHNITFRCIFLGFVINKMSSKRNTYTSFDLAVSEIRKEQTICMAHDI